MPTVYSYSGSITEGESSVSYTGQTARHILMLGMVDAMVALTERPGEEAAIDAELSFFMNGDGADGTPHGFTVKAVKRLSLGQPMAISAQERTLMEKLPEATARAAARHRV